MGGADTTGVLVSTVRAFWPSAEVRLVRRRRREPGATAEYLVVPHARAPRLLVPEPRVAAARSMLRFSEAVSARETVGRLGMASGLAAGGAPAFPDRVVVRGGAGGSLAEHLSGLLGREVTFSVGVGNDRVNRKPVLQVFDRGGRSLAFVKVGDSPVSRTDVGAEAAALALLGDRSWRNLELPTVVHHGSWRDNTLLVMTAMPTRPRLPAASSMRLPHAAMAELTDAFGRPAVPLGELDWLHRHRRVAAGLRDARHRDRFLCCIDTLVERAGDRPCPVGAWHGDWTPWNMDRAGGVVRLWDWERFETGVPRGLDPFHYAVHTTIRRRGTRPESVSAGLAAAGATSDPGSTSWTLAALYLVAAAGRFLPHAEVAHGAHIHAHARCVLTTLADWVARDRVRPGQRYP